MTSLCQCTTSVVLLKWQQINASKKVTCLEKKNICYLYSDRWIIRFFWWHTDTRLSFVFHYTEKICFFVFVLLFYCTSNSTVSVPSYTPNKPTKNKDLKHRIQMFPEGTDDLFTFTYKTKHKQSHQHTTAEVFEHFYYDEWLKSPFQFAALYEISVHLCKCYYKTGFFNREMTIKLSKSPQRAQLPQSPRAILKIWCFNHDMLTTACFDYNLIVWACYPFKTYHRTRSARSYLFIFTCWSAILGTFQVVIH